MATDVSFTSADGTCLSGSLAVPRHEPALAGIVLVSGSGPSDRHNGGFFDDLCDELTAGGLAVLAYDKRGVAASDRQWASAGVGALAADARSAVAVLRSNKALKGSRVGLFGHSEGGWVALRAAVCPERPDFLVLNSCPAASFLRSEVYALTLSGVDARSAAQALNQLAALAGSGGTHVQARDVLTRHGDKRIGAAVAAELTEDTWAQFIAWFDYDPAADLADLADLKVPTLAVFGDQDVLTPVAESITSLQALAHGLIQTVTFPRADHRIRVDADYAAGYFQTLIDWCTSSTP